MATPAARMSLFYGAIFAYVGVVVPFWPVWLKAQGLDAAQIGIALAAGMVGRAAISPLIASLADRSGRPDRMLAVLGWATAGSYTLYLAAAGFVQILMVSVLTALLFSAILPLADSITMLKVREGELDYGRVRLWGSVTFILASTAGGWVLTGRPESIILWLAIGALLVSAVCAHLAPEARTPGTARLWASLAATIRNRPLVLFLLAASVLQASHGVGYGFATLHWRAAGHDEIVIGALWAEGVIAEIALFAISGRVVARVGPRGLLIVAAVAGIVRWLTLGSTTALPALIAVQCLHGLTFGATHVAAMHFIAREIPAAFAATGQSVYSAAMSGTMTGLSVLAAGWLYGHLAGGAFDVMAALSLVGGLMAFALGRQDAGRP